MMNPPSKYALMIAMAFSLLSITTTSAEAKPNLTEAKARAQEVTRRAGVAKLGSSSGRRTRLGGQVEPGKAGREGK